MLRQACVSCLCAVFLFLSWNAFSQPDIPRSVPEDYSPTLFVDPVAFLDSQPGMSRLDVFIEVGYDNLTFVKEGDTYRAGYELTITIEDTAGTHVAEKTSDEEIKGMTFDQSVSSGSFALLQRSFMVPPGRYTVTAAIRDNDSKVVRRETYRCHVHDFGGLPVALSDIMIVSRLSFKGDKRSIQPNVSPNVGSLSEPFYAFFEMYNRVHPDSVRFEVRVYDTQRVLKMRSDSVQFAPQGRSELFMRVDQTRLPMGDYVLEVRAYPRNIAPGADSGFIAFSVRPFIVRWRGMPRSLKDIDVAIDELQYIAKDNELDEMRSAKTLEEKQRKFLEFWRRRSTNPNASRNLRMEQYYARVDYANKHFSHYREGWRSDMGLVYIVLGPPSNVDRHPFEIDSKPYEIWAYYDLNYQYVFVDENGFGDYRLITPLSEVFARRRD